jgi:hypothetical protein
VSAERQLRRKVTAKAAAQKLGVSERTIQRIVAEPRADYEARTRARQDLALHLREQGLSWADVGRDLGCSSDAARVAANRARTRAHQAAETMPPPLFT